MSLSIRLEPIGLRFLVGSAGRTVPVLLIDTLLNKFWVAFGAADSGRAVCYLCFEQILGGAELITERPAKLFGLAKVRLECSPCPDPVVALSGALWTQLAALEGLSEALISHWDLSQPAQFSMQSKLGGFPHET